MRRANFIFVGGCLFRKDITFCGQNLRFFGRLAYGLPPPWGGCEWVGFGSEFLEPGTYIAIKSWLLWVPYFHAESLEWTFKDPYYHVDDHPVPK